MNTSKNRQSCPGRPQAGKDKNRREHILNCALSLFASQGIAGTTIAQIAKAAGVTPAMVHYYFNNRAGLLDALAGERLASALDYIWGGLTDAALADPEKIITEFVDRLLDTIEKMPQLPLLWSREILNAGGLLRERMLPLIPQDKVERVRRSFSAAQQEGRFNAQVASGLVLNSVLAIVMLPFAVQGSMGKTSPLPAFDKDMLRQHTLALLIDGLCLTPTDVEAYK